MKPFRNCLDKSFNVWKAFAALKFFIEYRYHQNNNIEDVAIETLKEMEEHGVESMLNKELDIYIIIYLSIIISPDVWDLMLNK